MAGLLFRKLVTDVGEAHRPARGSRNARTDRFSPESDLTSSGAKLRVDNLHYDLTEDDLEDLFTRIGPVSALSLRFDRAGRSSGTAFVTYASIHDARTAIREFDGANANGQPIRLTLTPTAPAASTSDSSIARGRGGAVRNPFDTAVKPGRSLFERVENPERDDRRGRITGSGRSRSRSPGAPRRTNTSKPAPEGVDRYVPPPADSRNGRRRRSRTRSPIVRGRREGWEERGRGRVVVNGRVRKTQEELDQEMEDYWGGGNKADGAGAAGKSTVDGDAAAMSTAVQPVADDGDIDMIE
ncbi:hypothetical protein MMC07_007053 [Pseudocyphellaria aurata]|nr:hypothetical protein [Pseudocyphellaria aurata]